uniref:Secreted protein n=1 Tax=Arundo donax TaxID=35708 RepID=A0A0A9EVB1_ARUDO
MVSCCASSPAASLGFSLFCLSVGATSTGDSVLPFSTEGRCSVASFACSFGPSASASSADSKFMVVGGRKTPAVGAGAMPRPCSPPFFSLRYWPRRLHVTAKLDFSLAAAAARPAMAAAAPCCSPSPPIELNPPHQKQ